MSACGDAIRRRVVDEISGKRVRMTAGPSVEASGSDPLSHRTALHTTVAMCLLAVMVQLGWIPHFRFAWGFTLWQYLVPPFAWTLAALMILACIAPARGVMLRSAGSLYDFVSRPAMRPLRWAAFAALPLCAWVVRERTFLGDSKILLYTLAAMDRRFFFPDVGATFLLKSSLDLGRWSGVGGVAGVQILICLAIWPALFCFHRAATYLTPTARWAGFATALIMVGGVARIYAGHIEVYSIVLFGLGVYFWASLAYLRGGRHWFVPCLALGFGLWIHLCFLFLIPSLLLLPILTGPPYTLGRRFVQWGTGLVVAILPLVGFLALLVVLGVGDDLFAAWRKLVKWSEVGARPDHYGTVWIRPPWEPSEGGTKYVLYSPGHLKFLANSFFLLAPAAVPVVLAYAAFSVRRFWSTPEAAFLSIAALAMLAYASIVRPVFGPYEWDLFIVTAVCLAALAAHLLANTRCTPSLLHLCTLLLAASTLLVAVPWIAVGVHAHRNAGPFAIDALHPAPDGSFYEDFVRKLEPWL